MLLCDLFDPSDVCEHLFPIALTLAGDRVADVRFTAYKLVSVLVRTDGAIYPNEISVYLFKYRMQHVFLCEQKCSRPVYTGNKLYTFSHLENDHDITEHANRWIYTLQDVSLQRRSRDYILNM